MFTTFLHALYTAMRRLLGGPLMQRSLSRRWRGLWEAVYTHQWGGRVVCSPDVTTDVHNEATSYCVSHRASVDLSYG